MDLVTITALLYVASAAFFHAGKKRSAFARLRASLAWRRTVSGAAWLLIVVALALIVSRKGWEVGVFLWLGAWVAAAIASVFVHAIWKRAHLPSTAGCLALFAFGLVTVPWGAAL